MSAPHRPPSLAHHTLPATSHPHPHAHPHARAHTHTHTDTHAHTLTRTPSFSSSSPPLPPLDSNDAIIPSPDPDFFGDSDYLCCDGVFLPAVSVLNAQSPDKIFVKSYSIGFVDGDEPGVQYKLEIQGSYFTQMSFKVRSTHAQPQSLQSKRASAAHTFPH